MLVHWGLAVAAAGDCYPAAVCCLCTARPAEVCPRDTDQPQRNASIYLRCLGLIRIGGSLLYREAPILIIYSCIVLNKKIK